jgi:omega-amidase
MRITVIQTSLHWEDKPANLAMFEALLAPLAGQTDLIVLPEMFTTGFSMKAAQLAEPMDGPTVTWMQQQAAATGAAVAGSIICTPPPTVYYPSYEVVQHGKVNRLLFIEPNGTIHIYDKRHLFGLAGEHEHFSAGTKQVTITWKGWRIKPMICYDLRFPVWSRQTADAPYDLLLYVANWPAPRAHHWRALLSARAIENQAYVAAVNIVGTDGEGRSYIGDSGLLDYHGQYLGHLQGQAGVLTLDLDLDELHAYRAKFPFLADADAFTLRVSKQQIAAYAANLILTSWKINGFY